MGNMRFKVGDRVRIKSIDWYNENKNEGGDILCGELYFSSPMKKFCSNIITISTVFNNCYLVKEDNGDYYWKDEMIEGLVEERHNDCKKCGLIRNPIRCLFMDNCPHNKQKNIIEIPKGFIFKDENGNEILISKIILEKKKKEYPKTYEECCGVLGIEGGRLMLNTKEITEYEENLICKIGKLEHIIVCRDAYWKIAGEEMRLGKPWEPDWNNISDKYCIYFVSGDAWLRECQTRQCPFAFPTPEMRDAFYENFKSDIEICKELL